MSNVSQRIKNLYESLELNQADFCTKIGAKHSAISLMITRGTSPSYDLITKILIAYPDLSARWLLLGVGEMWESSGGYEGVKAAPKQYILQDSGGVLGGGSDRVKELETINKMLLNQIETLQNVINRL